VFSEARETITLPPLLNAESFANKGGLCRDRLRNHQPVNSFYDSAARTPGLIDTTLPTGRFQVVFINGLESFAPKNVFAD